MTSDKFDLAAVLAKSQPVDKVPFIETLCKNKTVLDMGCIRHNAEFAFKDPNWLHKKIKKVAKKTVGVDYMREEVKKMNNAGYNILYGDVTKPLKIKGKFDVIVAGDLIEHLANFEGFFKNCQRLMKTGAQLVITTPNPFFSDEFHYVAFKKNYLMNPEHTCWIDPLCLAQLAARYGYSIREIRFLKHRWQLRRLVSENKRNSFDILNERWNDQSLYYKIVRKFFTLFFDLFYSPYKLLTFTRSSLVKYSDYIAVLTKDDLDQNTFSGTI
jgi:SAM-dependent methyltransferase